MRQYMIMTLQHTAPLACRLKGPEAWHLWLVTLASVLHMVLLTFYVFFCLTDVSQEGSVYVYIYIFNLHIWKHAVATWWKKRNHKMQIIFIRYRASTLKKTDASLVTSSQGFNQAKPRTPTKLEKASRRRPRHACTARVSAPGVVSVTACLTFSKACKATKKKEREREGEMEAQWK